MFMEAFPAPYLVIAHTDLVLAFLKYPFHKHPLPLFLGDPFQRFAMHIAEGVFYGTVNVFPGDEPQFEDVLFFVSVGYPYFPLVETGLYLLCGPVPEGNTPEVLLIQGFPVLPSGKRGPVRQRPFRHPSPFSLLFPWDSKIRFSQKHPDVVPDIPYEGYSTRVQCPEQFNTASIQGVKANIVKTDSP